MSTQTERDDQARASAGSAPARPAEARTRSLPGFRSQGSMIWGMGPVSSSRGTAPTPAEVTSHGTMHSDTPSLQRAWGGGWRRWIFPGVWLVYLAQTASGVHEHSHGFGAIIGYLIIAAFAVLYLGVLPSGWIGFTRPLRLMFAAMLALVVVEAFLAHEDAFAMLVYVAVVCVAAFGRWGLVAVAFLTAVVVVTPALIPSWNAGVQWDSLITLPLVALAMFGFFAIIRANRALTEARAEVARLAAENERSRIARDLHDLLGHSLTTISVKAQLARRLSEIDPARAALEIAEVEELTRSSLTQVRAAVAGYREITLAGELATSREVLRSAGIDGALPTAIDEVPPQHDELFGWVLREAVTNVVRHSRATRCTVRVEANLIEIKDNGRGGPSVSGNGLAGLRERVEAAGGEVRVGSEGAGWTVCVHVPSVDPATPAVTC